MDPNIDEKSIRHQDPKELVLALAYAKASALLPQINEPTILITADQVVYCNNKILEKPEDKNEAKEFLRMYAKYPATTITAIAVTNTASQKQAADVDVATIWFHPIPEDVIDIIVNQECTLTCAGGFTLDSPIINSFVAKIAGSPKELTEKLIQKVLS